MTNRTDDRKTQENNEHGKQGFASMPKEQVQEIASKGGQASADNAGHEGMAERGRLGGEARKEQIGPEGYAEMGRKGGQSHGDANEENENNDKDEE